MRWKVARIAPGFNRLRQEYGLLSFAWKDKRTPWYAKAGMAFAIVYLLSPVDLLPDVVPLAGLLDDMILVPLSLMGASWAIPSDVKTAFARSKAMEKSRSRLPWLLGTVLLVIVCIVAAAWLGSGA